MRAVTEEALMLRLASLCARSEQCSGDIKRKVLKAGLSYAQAEKIIAYLREHKFIDDARFAHAFAHDKVAYSGWGRKKVAMQLRARGISSEDIGAALDDIDEVEYEEVLRRLIESRSRSLDLSQADDRSRLMRFLMTRGFEYSLISKNMPHA